MRGILIARGRRKGVRYGTVGLINIATKTPVPVPLDSTIPLMIPLPALVELELEFWLQYLSPTVYFLCPLSLHC